MRQRWAGSMATTLAQPSQPPRTSTNLAITLTFKTPHTAPTPLRTPPPQGYVLKLPNTFLLQHGSKIHDGLIVLKLVSPNPNPNPNPNSNPSPNPNPSPSPNPGPTPNLTQNLNLNLQLHPYPNPTPNPNQVAGLGRCAGLPLNLSGMPYEVVSMARAACRQEGCGPAY